MAKRIDQGQRTAILQMLAEGLDRNTIAAHLGVTPAQVSAVSAHVTMGTYRLESPGPATQALDEVDLAAGDRLIHAVPAVEKPSSQPPIVEPIPIGCDAETGELASWNPDASNGAANPHVLVLGESGFGKTYAICCLLTELAQQGIPSFVFDYAQGFSRKGTPAEFHDFARPVEFDAARHGININPLQPFPFDMHGPASVGQRIADTFQRVYPRIGVQQHAVLRQAVVDSFSTDASRDGASDSNDGLPAFETLQNTLERYASTPEHPHRRHAATVASHISTVFVFNTFRSNGRDLAWGEMIKAGGRVHILKLRGLEHSLERVVTEFLLWNLIGFIESLGPGPLRCFIVLDEAHKLSFATGSPAEKLLREGRKFGLGLILASQQPEDFSPVAFANTATKLVFQVGDEHSAVSRQLHRKVKNAHSFGDIYQVITRLPRGWAYFVTENVGRVTRVLSIEERAQQWKP